MLSWSSTKTNSGTVDLTAVAQNRAEEIDLENGGELLRFASACGGTDDTELDASRAALTAATNERFMVDAAAVAANFEMMTRLADGTGARLGDDVVEQRAAAIGAMGVAELTSRR
jgi:hypothetical protein